VNAGLAVMGQNLILNMNDHGFTVVAYNRTTSKVDDFLQNEVMKIFYLKRYINGEQGFIKGGFFWIFWLF
jgi:6-phosphogluconate dehydrogenase